MNRVLRLTVILLLSLCQVTAQALPPAPAPAQSNPIAVTNVTIHVGNTQVIERGVVTFSAGEITGVYESQDNPNLEGHEVYNLEGEHLYPGFILPNTRLGLTEVNSVRASVDDKERGALNASVRSLVAYNTDSEVIPTFRFNGVLTAQITPRGSLVAGSSSIVQLDAWNWQDAAIKANDAMHITWPKLIKSKTDVLKQQVSYEHDESYDEKVAAVKNLFAEARNVGASTNLNLKAVSKVLDNQQQLFIHAETARQLVDAVSFVQQFDIQRAVLVGASEALMVADLILEADIPILVQFVHGLPAAPGDSIDQSYARAAQYKNAGFTIGLGARVRMQPASGRNLPFLAGTTAAYGLAPEQAVQLITQANAQLLGIEDVLGTIEVGKLATLFVSKGDALDMRSNQVTVAFIRGRKVEIRGMQQELHERFSEKYSD